MNRPPVPSQGPRVTRHSPLATVLRALARLLACEINEILTRKICRDLEMPKPR
jgi:hypothetical protein